MLLSLLSRMSLGQVQLLERWMTSMLTAHAGNLNRKGDKNECTKAYNSGTTTRNSPECCEHPTSSGVSRSPYTYGDVSDEAAGGQAKSEVSVKGGLEMEGRMQEVGGAQKEDDAGQAGSEAEEKKANVIRAQMSVLMLGFYEIVRQVIRGESWRFCAFVNFYREILTTCSKFPRGAGPGLCLG